MKAADLVKQFEFVRTGQVNPTTGRLFRVRIDKKEVSRFYEETLTDQSIVYSYKICGVHVRASVNRESAILQMAQGLEKYFDLTNVPETIDKLLQQVKTFDENAVVVDSSEMKSHLKILEVTLKQINFSHLNYKCIVKISKVYSKHQDTRMIVSFIYRNGKKKAETLLINKIKDFKSTVRLKIFGDVTGVFD